MVRVGVWLTWNTACSDRSLRGKLSRTAEFFKVAFATTSRVQCSTSFEFESSLSPPPLLVLSLLLHLSPRANVYHLLPTLMGRTPSRSTPRRLPSSHLSHPHPLPLVLVSGLHYDLARFLAPRASLDLPPSLSRVAGPLVLFARRVLCFSRPPVTLDFCTTPSPQAFVHVHACAAAQAN